MENINTFKPTNLPASDVLAGIRNGGMAVVATSTRVIYMDKKVLARFDKGGNTLLMDAPSARSGKAYRMASGRSFVFLFPGQLQINF